jgi:hypothetical protein
LALFDVFKLSLVSQAYSGFIEREPVASAPHQKGTHLRWCDPVGKGEPFDFKRIGSRRHASPLDNLIASLSPHDSCPPHFRLFPVNGLWPHVFPKL